MAEVETLLIPLLMGLSLAAVVLFLVRREPIQGLERPDRDLTARLTQIAQHPVTWLAGFLLLTLGFGGGIILYVSGDGLSEVVQQALGVMLVVAAFATFAGFLFSGFYGTARSHGLTSAQATMIGGWGIGLLFLGAIVVKLIVA